MADTKKWDIVFIIDTTGSMSGYIRDVKTQVETFVDALDNYKVDYNLGLVTYGDLAYTSDKITTYALTDNTETFKANLPSQTTTYGGWGASESGLEAIMAALSEDMNFRDDAEKEFIVITDAPFHDSEDTSDIEGDKSTYLNTDDVKKSLQSNGVTLDAVGTTNDQCETEWKDVATSTTGTASTGETIKGAFYDISEGFSSILKRLAKKIYNGDDSDPGAYTHTMSLSGWTYGFTPAAGTFATVASASGTSTVSGGSGTDTISSGAMVSSASDAKKNTADALLAVTDAALVGDSAIADIYSTADAGSDANTFSAKLNNLESVFQAGMAANVAAENLYSAFASTFSAKK